MKKKVWIPLAIVAVLIVAVYMLSRPTGPGLQPKQVNSDLYSQLQGAGIDEAVVDVTEERALVRYNVPENMTKEATAYLVMGAAAGQAENSSKVVVQIYDDFEAVEEMTVSMSDITSYKNGEMTFSELQSKITTKPLSS